MRLRLIAKVPDTCQTGPDTWQDTTKYQTFVVDAPDSLVEAMREKDAVVIVPRKDLSAAMAYIPNYRGIPAVERIRAMLTASEAK